MTDADKTLKSLKEIHDFPFYTARYYGDYKIKEFAEGAIKGPADIVPFFSRLFKELGRPVDLSFPSFTADGPGCSAFFCRDSSNNALVGKNLDWKKDPVLLLKTLPESGYASLSMVNLNHCDIFRLQSFEHNLLLSPYVPMDGINEKGLIVTMLAVHEGAQYPQKLGRLSVGDFNILRIILDTCATVDEALAVFKRFNLMQSGSLPLHYLVADGKESCIVEFFNGEMHIQRDTHRQYLTNFLVLDSSEFEHRSGICDRYRLLENHLSGSDTTLDIKGSKRLLERVSVYTEGYRIPSTIWSLVYSVEDLSMKIKIGRNPDYSSVSLKGER